MSDPKPKPGLSGETQHATILRRLHASSRAVAAAQDEAAVGQLLMKFAASGDTDVARLLILVDFEDGHPTMLEMREGWTVDDRPAQPYGTRLPLDDYPLLEFMDADTIFVCEDVESDERLNESTRQIMALSGLGSFAIVPLTAGQHWLGAVIIGRNTPATYKDDLLYAWWTLAGQAAAAIQNARLIEDRSRHTQELSILQRMSLELAQEQQDLDTLLETITQQAKSLLNADDAGIWLQEGQRTLELTFTTDKSSLGRQLEPGEGLSGQALSEREIQVVDDYQSWSDRPEIFDDAPFVAAMAIPLTWQAQVLGVLTITRNQPGRPFSADEQSLAELLAGQAAAAIQNARTHKEAQQKLRDLSLLLDTSTVISSSLEMEEILQTTTRQIAEALDAQGCAISTWDKKQNVLVTQMDYTIEPETVETEAPGTVYPLDEYPLSRKVLTSRQPEIIQASDPDADPAEVNWMKEQGTASVLMVPMVVRDKVVGMLELMHGVRSGEREFTSTEVALCQNLSNQVAAAIENARLFEQSQTALIDAEALYRASLSIGTADSPKAIAEVTIDYIATHAVDTARVLWLEYDGDQPSHLRFGPAWRRGRPVRTTDMRLSLSDYPLSAYMDPEEALVVSDVLADERTDGTTRQLLVEQFNLRAFAMIPMAQRDRWFGYLFVGREAPGAFPQQEIQKYVTLATQATVALDNRHLYAQEQERRRQTEAVVKIGQTLASTLNLNTILPQLMEQVAQVMDVPQCGIVILDQEAGVGHVLAEYQRDADGTSEQVRIPIAGNAMLEKIIETHEPLIIADAENDPLTAPIRDVIEMRHIKSILVTPMLVGGRLLGTLGFDSLDEHRHFTKDQVRIATMIAGQLAAALQSAELFDQTQQRLADLVMIQETTSRLTTASTQDKAIAVLLSQATNAVQADTSSLSFVNQDRVTHAAIYPDDQPPSAPIGEVYSLAEHPLTQKAIETREPLALKADDARLGDYEEAALKTAGITSQVILPIAGQEGILGILSVSSRQPNRAFDEHDVRLLQTLTKQATLTFERIRLLEGATRRAQQEHILRQITARVRGSTNADTIMRTAVREVSAALGRPTFVRMGDDQELRTPDATGGASHG